MLKPSRHLVVAACCTLAAACAFGAGTARAAGVCGEGMYAYAGFAGQAAVGGVSATIRQSGPLEVHAGHVAGWIGIVEPQTSSAWLQVGLSALPGETSSAIYYEYAAPGRAPVYHQVAAGIAAGEPHTFAVREQPKAKDTWTVWVDGRRVGQPLHLRGSDSHWTAQVLGESWAGATSGACNAYSYGFANVRLVTAKGRPVGLGRRPIADPNYIVADRTRTGFVASSFGGPAGLRGAAVETQQPEPQPQPAAPSTNQ